MHAWEAIQKSLDYIEEKLPEDIRIESLAGVASLSPYYYQRLFGRLVKKPVIEYVKLRRLAKASEALKNKGKRILDIAFDWGFSDHACFTRAFKDAYGITPDEYRACPVILNHFVKPDLSLNHVEADEGVPLVVDGIILEVTRREMLAPRIFVGIAGEVPETELTGGRATGISTAGMLWGDFHSQKSDIPHLLPDGGELGVLYAGNAREGCCTYLAGAEAIMCEGADGYTRFTLPRGEYVVCRLEAESFAELIDSAVFKASTFMNVWMKKRGLTCGDFCAEIYGNKGQSENFMELWLPLGALKGVPAARKTREKTDGAEARSLEAIATHVNSPRWGKLCGYLEEAYKSKPVLEYSRCSMQYGWNVKYRKAGRTLCTLYPMEGYYIALVVIGERERTETEWTLPSFTEYLQRLYRETKTGMGQKWLMICVTDDAILEDVKRCIAIRSGKKEGSPGGSEYGNYLKN